MIFGSHTKEKQAKMAKATFEITPINKPKVDTFNMIPDEILKNIFEYANEPEVAMVNQICYNVWMRQIQHTAYIINGIDFEYFCKWYEMKKPLITTIIFSGKYDDIIRGSMLDTVDTIHFAADVVETGYGYKEYTTSNFTHSLADMPPNLIYLDIRWCYHFRRTYNVLPKSLQFLALPYFTLHPYRDGIPFFNPHNSEENLLPHITDAIELFNEVGDYWKDNVNDELRTHISSDGDWGDDIANLGDLDD